MTKPCKVNSGNDKMLEAIADHESASVNEFCKRPDTSTLDAGPTFRFTPFAIL